MPKFKIEGIEELKEYESYGEACLEHQGKAIVQEDYPWPMTPPDLRLEPLGNRIIVERFEYETTYGSGLILKAETYQNPPAEGTIIAAGPGRKLDDGTIVPMDVKVGEQVFFAKYSGSEIEIEGKDCLIMTEAEVIARIK